MPTVIEKKQDAATAAIYAALKKAFPELPDEPGRVVYRYHPAAVRLKVVSRAFSGKSMTERWKALDRALAGVPEELTGDITLRIMLTPAEAKRPNSTVAEFDDPADWPD